MRHFFNSCLVVFCAQSAQSAYALYNANPSSPMMPEQGLFFSHAWLSLKGGYTFDDVFDRKLKMQNPPDDDVKRDIKKYLFRAQFGVVTIDFGDRMEIYGGLGNMWTKFSQKEFADTTLTLRTQTRFAWTIGGRLLLAYWKDLQFGLNASCLRYSAPLESSPEDGHMRYSEWQVGAGLSYHFWWLYPYIGIKFANAWAHYFDLDPLHESFKLKNRKECGLVLGCGLAAEKALAVNVEGRFFDETAFTISADIKF